MVLFRFMYTICSFSGLNFTLFIIDVLQDIDCTVPASENVRY